MNTTSLGRTSERVVAEYLVNANYKILEMNWRRRVCEIDIVASKNKTVYFVEVKHRSKPEQGSGLEYITAKKLKQMEFAAELWVAENGWTGDWQLLAAEVSVINLKPRLTQLVEI